MSNFARKGTNSYNNNAVVETRTLQTGAGVLQSININRIGGLLSTLTLYDNIAASGKILGSWDLTSTNNLGTIAFGMQGLDFTIGLTYVTTGTLGSSNITFFWNV